MQRVSFIDLFLYLAFGLNTCLIIFQNGLKFFRNRDYGLRRHTP